MTSFLDGLRYFGIFSNHHSLRERIRPEPGAPLAVAPTQVPLFDVTGLRPWDKSYAVRARTAPYRASRVGLAFGKGVRSPNQLHRAPRI